MSPHVGLYKDKPSRTDHSFAHSFIPFSTLYKREMHAVCGMRYFMAAMLMGYLFADAMLSYEDINVHSKGEIRERKVVNLMEFPLKKTSCNVHT